LTLANVLQAGNQFLLGGGGGLHQLVKGLKVFMGALMQK